jgi:probable HAF family extracellular repeat protein
MTNHFGKSVNMTGNDDASPATDPLIPSATDSSAFPDWQWAMTVTTSPAALPRSPAGQGAPEPQAGAVPTGLSLAQTEPAGGLVFQNSFGLDGTFNSLTASEQTAFVADIQQAEADLSAEFSNTLTGKVDFEVVSDASAPFNAANQASAQDFVFFSAYANALQNVATSSYQTNAVAAIKALSDLGQNAEVELPDAYARMLGLSGSGTRHTNSSISLGSTQYQLSASVDDTVFVNLALMGETLDSQTGSTPNSGIVGVLEHELTEDVMGRIGVLQQQGTGLWGPTDLFRVNSSGQSFLTPDTGSKSTAVFFSPAPGVLGPASSLQFNNSPSNGDFADWTNSFTSDPSLSDPFGPGDFESDPANPSISSQLSPTDIDLMNVLGWSLTSGGGTVLSLTINLQRDTGASSTDNVTSNSALIGVTKSNATVSLTENGGSLGTVIADTGGAWSFAPALADGVHTITATETGGTGQPPTATISFTLATKAPTVNASESVSGQTGQSSDTITVSATAENVGANAITGVEIFDGAADLGSAILSANTWTFTARNLLPGAHNLLAKATDTAGNSATFSLQQVTVTGTQPTGQYTFGDFSFTGDGVTDIRPKGINDSGEVVGYYIDARPDDIGADGQTYYEHGFLSTMSNSVRQYFTIDDPDPAADASTGEIESPDRARAFAVNNKGDIVGWFSQDQLGVADDGHVYVLPDAGYILSANWPGTYGTLGFTAFGDYGTHALGINSGDQIVGYYVDAVGVEHGFLRNFTGYGVRGGYISLDPTGSINTMAEGINDDGQIVGLYETADLADHGFIYNIATNAFTPIDVNGATSTEALGVNNSGAVVGVYFDGSGKEHGFVRTSTGQFTIVDDPNAGTGGTLVGGINNEGEIVGWYTGSDGHDHGFTATPNVFCFAADTKIATPLGETPVQSLRPGDRVLTADGRECQVVRIGHRRIDCCRHPLPEQVWPVRIRAGAIAANVPRQDLLVSPNHAVLIGDALVPAKYLIEGAAIAQMPADTVDYYHVELPEHDLLLANGLAAESHLDAGDSAGFFGDAGTVRLFPDLATVPVDAGAVWEARGCRPLVVGGTGLEAARALVRTRVATRRGEISEGTDRDGRAA